MSVTKTITASVHNSSRSDKAATPVPFVMECLLSGFYAITIIYFVRTVTNMPERWPEVLTAVILVASVLYTAIRSVNKMSESIDRLDKTMHDFKTDFREKTEHFEKRHDMLALQVEGNDRRLAVLEAERKITELLLDRFMGSDAITEVRHDIKQTQHQKPKPQNAEGVKGDGQ